MIAREIMKFAANGLLYRGSKPVMWSVVEKTALAEAEVEYHDHTLDDSGCFRWPFAGARARRRQRGDLDDDALDLARQPRHRLLAPNRLRPLPRRRRRRGQLGESRRRPTFGRQAG